MRGGNMKTYVELFVSSDGAPASEITEILKEMGFVVTMGNHDFSYEWPDKRDVTSADVIDFCDKVQKHLAGKEVMLKFTTL